MSKETKNFRKAKLAEFTKENGLAVADFYEYSMADANIREDYFGLPSVFDLVVRNLPVTKVAGQFEHEGVTYDKLEKRRYMINAGLEQAVAILAELKGNSGLKDYFKNVMENDDPEFLGFVEKIEFKGDLYTMREGEIFFGQEPQLRMHERFEVAQAYESLLLSTINPQTNVAMTADDIADVVNEKVLLEGGSRRAGSPQGAILNTRAAMIGGFHATSNIAFGMLEGIKVGGTHGHSYVMLHEKEYDAFAAQAKAFGKKVCFLLDTYNVKSALEKAIEVIKKYDLDEFAFRVDSGDLAKQYHYITKRIGDAGFEREQYKMVASDDLNPAKIAQLEKTAGFDKYLVGTFLVYPPKPLGGVFKLAAFTGKDENSYERGKFSENIRKATLPAIKQVYRIAGEDGMFKKDIIAIEGEDIISYLEEGDAAEPLLIKTMEAGKQVYSMPTTEEISKYRQERLARLPEKYRRGDEAYPVIVSDALKNAVAKQKDQVDLEARCLMM